MVKKLPTIERSKTISIGEKILDNQADKSVVINASDEYINTESNNVYISPIQTVSDTGTFLAYDHITKRLINSDIGVTELLTNIHSTTLQLTNGNTSLITSGNVGISNTNPTDTLSIGDRIMFSDTSLDYTMKVNQGGITIGDNITIHPDEYYALNVSGNALVNDMTVSGNLVVQGDTFIVEANSFSVSDRIIGIANNNQTHTFDVGIIMDHPGKNLALIHHGENGTPHDHNFTIGYTQNNKTDFFILNDPLNPVTVEVLGNLVVQNNITISSGGSIYGDGTQLTGVALKTDLYANVIRIGNLESNLSANAIRIGNLESNLSANVIRIGNLESNLSANVIRIGNLESNLSANVIRIGNLESNLNANVIRIGNLESNLNANVIRIGNLESNLSANVIRIGNLESNLSANVIRIGNLESNLSANAIRIGNLESNLSANVIRIGNLESNLSANVIRIGNLESNLSTNAIRIGNLESNLSANVIRIGNLESNLSANAIRIDNLESNLSANAIRIGNLESNLNANVIRIGNLESNLNANVIRIGNLESNLSANVIRIGNLESNLSANVIRIGNLESNLSANVIRIGNLESNLSANVLRIDNLETKTTAISYTDSTTVISSNLEIQGDIIITGDTYIIDSNTVVIQDRVLGIANNNTTHTLDIGIIMEHPDKNIALIHHGESGTPHDHTFTIGYTQNTITDDYILDDTSNIITVEVLGNLVVQNNITISSGGSIYGDGTKLTGVALGTELDDVESDVIDLTSNVNRVKNNLTSNSGRIGVLESDVADLTSNLSSNVIRIGNLESNLSANAIRIDNLESNLSANAIRIDNLESNLSANVIRIGNLESNLSANAIRIDNLESNLSANVIRIGNLESNLSANVIRIGNLESNLSANAIRIDNLESNLSANAIRIGNLESNLNANAIRIGNLESNLSANVIRIGNLESNLSANAIRIGNLESNLSANAIRIGNLESNLSANAIRIGNLESNLSANVIRIGNLESDLNANVIRIGNLESNLSANVIRIGNLESNLSANAIRIGNLESNLSANVIRIGNLESNLSANASRIETLETKTTDISYINGTTRISGNIVSDNVVATNGMYGNIKGSNTISASTISAITINSNVVGDNVVTTNGMYGNIKGSNTISASTINAITINSNVIADNVVATNMYGTITGSNTINASTINAITINSNVIADNVYVTNNIETTSGFFKGDGGILSNVTLQQVTDTSNSTSNTVLFTNAHTAFTTDLTSNVGVKLDQLSNVIITDPNDHKSLLYIDGNWIDDYIDFTSIEVKAGEDLLKGNVVYIHDGSGDTPEVRKADSSSASTMPAIGIVMDGSINQNENGHVVTFGTFGMAFDANFQKGEILYVSNTTPGGLMNTVPFNNTDKIQNVGIVVKSGDKILVTGVGRSNDIPNAEEVYAQPTYVYVNSSGNELKKILASNLSANNQTLDMVTSWSNSTQNTIQSTHETTGFISSGNVHVGSNIFVSGLTDPTNNYLTMADKTTGNLIKSPAYVTAGGKYVIDAAEAEFTGNLTFTGNATTFSSNNVVIQDRIFGLGANNAVHNLDMGILMEHKDDGDYANVALIYHADEHRFSLGYTQNTFTDDHILHYQDPDHVITFDILGNTLVQNNLTLVHGDLTAITTNSNIVGDNVSVITLNGNVVSDNVVATNMYGTIAGSNTISASTIYVGTGTGTPSLGDYELRVKGDTEITGNLLVGGNVEASYYFGDGTELTGIALNSDLSSNVIRIGNLESNLSANVIRIGNLESNLSANAIRIGNLESNLSANVIRIGNLESNLSANVIRIGNLESNLSANVIRIGNLESNLSANAIRIGNLESNLSANVIRIGNLESNLSANVIRIGNLESNLSANAIRIGNLESNLSANAIRIDNLESNLSANVIRIGNLESNLSANAIRIGNLESNLSANVIRIGNLESNLSANAIRIGNLESNLSANAIRIDNLESNLSANVIRIGNLESNLSANVIRIGNLESNLSANVIRIGNLESNLSANAIRIGNLESKTTDISYTDGTTRINGNLTVLGNTTTLDTVNLIVQDPILQLSNASASVDSGILIARPSDTDNVFVGFDQSLSEFAIGFTDSHAGLNEIVVKDGQDFTLNVHGNVEASYYFGDGTELSGIALNLDLSSNAIRIGNLESNLSANVIRIGNLESNLSANVIRIGNLESNLSANAIRIGNLESNLSANAIRIGNLESNLSANVIRIGNLESNLSANAIRIGNLESNLSANVIRIGNLESNLSANAIRIGNLESNLSANAIRIGNLESNLSANAIRIGNLESNLSANVIRIGNLESNLSANVIRIGNLESNLSANAIRIGNLESNLSANVIRIGNLESNLSANVIRIGNLESNLSANAIRIGNLESNLSANAIRIDNLESNLSANVIRIGNLESNLSANAIRIGNLESNLSANAIRIGNLESNLSANVIRIGNLESNLSANAIRIDNLESNLSANVIRIGNLESNLSANVIRIGNLESNLSANVIRIGNLESNLSANAIRIGNLESKTTDISYTDGTTRINGNLTVLGNTTTLDTVNLIVQDPILQLSNASASVDSGILIARPSDTDNVFVGFDQSLSEFAIGFTDSHAGLNEIVVKDGQDFTLNVHGNVEASYYFGDGTELSGIALNLDLSSNAIRIGNLESNLSANVIRIGNLESNLSANVIRIGNLESNLSANAIRIGNLESNLSANAIRIGNLESNLSANVIRIGNLESNLSANAIRIGNLESNLSANVIRIGNLESNLSANAIRIGNLESNLSANAIRIGNLESNLSANAIRIDNLESNLSANVIRIGNLESNLSANAIRIGNLESNLSANVIRIGNLESNLSANVIRIGNLESNLSANAIRIGNLESNLSANVIRIGNLESNLSANAIRIGNLESNLSANVIRIGNLESNLSANAIRIGNLESNLSANAIRIGNLESNLSANVIRIGNLESNLSANAIRIGNLESNLSANVIRIGNLESNLSANVIRIGNLESNLSANVIRIGNLESNLSANVIRIGNLETKTTDISYTDGTTRINGNLTVLGNTTTLDTVNLIVQDPILQLSNASASVDSGILIARPSDTDNVFVGFDQSLSEFAIGFTDSHAGLNEIVVKDGQDFTLNVHGNVEASYFFGDGSQLSGIQTATPTLASVVDEGNATTNVVRFSNVTTGIEITSNIDFVNKITLKSTSVTKSNLFVVNAIQLDPDYAEPSLNVLSYNTTTGEIYDSGGQGGSGSSFNNITEENANVLIGSNLTINTFGSNVLTVSGNVSADNITINGLNVNSNVVSDNVVATNAIYGEISGSNAISASTVTASSFSGLGSSLTSLDAGNISSGTLQTARGGTGISSYTVGDILYASTSTALSKLSPGSSGQVLTTNGTGSAPTWTTASGFTGDIADYITHTSDSDTKFGFPSNDTFVVYTANSERFRIDSLGSVGIGGIPFSGTKLNITSSNQAGIRISDSQSNPYMLLQTGYHNCSIGLDDSTGQFIIKKDNAFSYDDRFNLHLPSGYLGLGTSNPNYKLDVVGDINFTSALHVGTNAGTSGQVLTSSGAGSAPTWTTVSGFTGDIADYITHTSDSDTKFGFPSNDTFVVYTANSERFRINSSGNVGIGGSTSSSRLNITSSNQAGIRISDSQSNPYMLLQTGYHNCSIGLDDSTGQFIIKKDNAFSYDDRFNLHLPSGYLGLGTSNPNYKLDVVGDINFTSALHVGTNAGTSGQVLTSSGAGSAPTWTTVSGFTGDIADYITHTSDSDTKFGFPSNDTFVVYTANSERFRINSSGNVGIGTTSPYSGTKLDIESYNQAGIMITDTYQFKPYILFASSTDGSIGIESGKFTIKNSYNFSTNDRFNLDLSNGNLGLGTTSPSYKLHVVGDINFTGALHVGTNAGTSGQVLTSSGPGSAPTWTTVSGGGSFSGDIADYITHTSDSDTKFGFPSNDTFVVYTANSERFRINSSGNVGIGTTSPYSGTKLDIESYNQAGIMITDTYQFKPYILFASSTDGSIGIESGKFTIKNSYNFSTNDRFNLDLSNGNLGLGTTSPSYKLHVVGDINFTGALHVGTNAGTSGQVLTSSGPGSAPTWTTVSGGGSFSGDIADYITHTSDTDTKFGFPSNDTFVVYTANSERFRINSNGDTTIGEDNDIGTGHRLTVVDGSTSNDGSYADLVITNMNENNNARILLGTPHQTTSSSAFKAAIIADGAGTYSRNDLHFCLENSTDNAANADLTDSRMVIKYDTGNVGIGITSPAHKLHVVGDIYASGNVTAYSDARDKKNLKTIEDPVSKIEKINGYTYEKDGIAYTGLVAQELLEVLPEAVCGSEKSGYGIAYGNIAGIFVEAIKELNSKIKALENKLSQFV